MAKIENYGFNLKEAPKEQEGEVKDYPPRKVEKNKDYVVTLDIENKNRGFKDKANPLENMKDNLQASKSIGGLKAFWEKAKNFLKRQSKDSLKLVTYEQQAEQQSAKLENESAKIEAQKKALAEMAEALYSPSKLKEQMTKVASIIERVGAKIEGGYADVTQALRKGNIEDSLKPKAIETIRKTLKDQKWDTENINLLINVLDNLKASVKSKRYDQKHTGKETGAGDILEGYANELDKKKIYSQLGKLIEEYKPLNVNNSDLGAVFNRPGSPGKQSLEYGLKAIEALKKMASNWPEKTKATFNDAEKFIKKDLGI